MPSYFHRRKLHKFARHETAKKNFTEMQEIHVIEEDKGTEVRGKEEVASAECFDPSSFSLNYLQFQNFCFGSLQRKPNFLEIAGLEGLYYRSRASRVRETQKFKQTRSLQEIPWKHH